VELCSTLFYFVLTVCGLNYILVNSNSLVRSNMSIPEDLYFHSSKSSNRQRELRKIDMKICKITCRYDLDNGLVQAENSVEFYFTLNRKVFKISKTRSRNINLLIAILLWNRNFVQIQAEHVSHTARIFTKHRHKTLCHSSVSSCFQSHQLSARDNVSQSK
jgi:uncharacterized membrane protein